MSTTNSGYQDKMTDLREALAEYAHDAWSGWMKYLYSKSFHRLNGEILIPAWAVKRWMRQMNTPYSELSEGEKDLDRAEADKMISIFEFTGKDKNRAVGVEIFDEIKEWLDEKTPPNKRRGYSRCPVCGESWMGDVEQHSFVCWVPRFYQSYKDRGGE